MRGASCGKRGRRLFKIEVASAVLTSVIISKLKHALGSES